MNKDLFNIERYTTPKTKQTWSGVEIVDYFSTFFEIPKTGAFGYTAWLRIVKNCPISRFQAEKVVEIMLKTERWLQAEKGEKMHRGKWMFNKFRREFKEKGVDKWIASRS